MLLTHVLRGVDETSTLAGNLLFVKGGTGCTCDPASAPPPGVVKVFSNHIISGAGLIEGGCDPDILGSPCLNPGKFVGDSAGIVLAIDGGMTVRNYLEFDVELSFTGAVSKVHVGKHEESDVEPRQLMILGKDVTGTASILVRGGTLQIDGKMKLTGSGNKFDMGQGYEPVVEFNDTACVEGTFEADDGILKINADVLAHNEYHFGAGSGESAPFPSLTIEVAADTTLALTHSLGTCSP